MGKLAEEARIEHVNDRLKEYKDMYYTKIVGLDATFFFIKRVE